MKKIIALLLSFLLVFSLVACGSSSKMADDSFMQAESTSSSPPKMYDADMNGAIMDEASDMIISVDSSIYSDPNAKIIRTAQMTIQTLDFDQSITDLAALTEKHGGYYETAQIESGGYYNQNARRSAYYVVRIPKESFVAFRDAIGSVGYVYSATEDTQDVGEEYYDTEARLETLTTKRERLLALLDKAELMEDIISLESALADVQYEIDMHTSTLRKYDSLIDYSTFTINLDEVVKIDEEPGPQESFGSKLLDSLKDGWSDFVDGLQDFTFWFARNITTLVILAVIIAAIVKIVFVVRKKRRNNTYDQQ